MRWCRLTVTGRDGHVLARVVLQGRGTPDVAAVDQVARWALTAARLGAVVRLGDVAPELRELLALAGLVEADEVPAATLVVEVDDDDDEPDGGLAVQVQRQPEGGEQALGAHEGQEELHPGDPAA
jgi:hypothetical protein